MRGERARGGSGEIDDAGLTRTAGMALRPSMKLIVAGAVSSPCTRAQVAPLCSNFPALTAQQRGLVASAQRG